jgi:hypothetical protein
MKTEYYLHNRMTCCAFMTDTTPPLVGIYYPDIDEVSDAITFTCKATCAYWWGQLALVLQSKSCIVRGDCPLPNNIKTLHERCESYSVYEGILKTRLIPSEKQLLVNLLNSAGETFEPILRKLGSES